MKYFLTLSMLVFLILLATSCSNNNTKDETSKILLGDEYYTNMYDYDNDTTFLGRSINMGNYLEAPSEGEWSGGRLIQESDFTVIKNAGFKTVRIPVRWSAHAETDAPYTVDTAFMARVTEVTDQAIEAGLLVVINVHHYTEMMDDPESRQSYHTERLDAIWDQICAEFTLSEYPEDILVFELLNEPNGTIDYDDWNGIMARLTDTIWTKNAASQNTGSNRRKIMIGTANWGHPDGLAEIELPSGCTPSNTIMTIHYYEPFHFTHQGAEWVDGSNEWIGTQWLGTEADKKPLLDLYSRVTEWNSQAGRGFEIYVGEFGAYTKYTDRLQQKAWTAFIAREAEKRKMSWGYWEFSSGFGAYDPLAGKWKDYLLDALIPKEDRP